MAAISSRRLWDAARWPRFTWARDPKINRKVAIKTIALAEEFSEEDLENAKAQFIREAESAGRLNHPNIITIYDTGEDGNVAYLAMEYFPGKALNFHTQSETLLPPDWVIELTARAAEALPLCTRTGCRAPRYQAGKPDV